MNGALLDEIFRRGLDRMIPTTPKHIGRALVGQVLMYLAVHADAHNRIAYGAAGIADDLGLDRRAVRHALAVLSGAGLIARTGGKRGRAIEYVLPVESWPGECHRDARLAADPRSSNVAGDVAGDVAGHVAGHVAGYPATKGREGKRRDARAASPDVDTPMPGVLTAAPQPCSKHPNGWHHADPCGRCASLREYDDQQRAANSRQPVHRARLDNPDTLDVSAAFDLAAHKARVAELKALAAAGRTAGAGEAVPAVDGEKPAGKNGKARPTAAERIAAGARQHADPRMRRRTS